MVADFFLTHPGPPSARTFLGGDLAATSSPQHLRQRGGFGRASAALVGRGWNAWVSGLLYHVLVVDCACFGLDRSECFECGLPLGQNLVVVVDHGDL